MGRLRDCKQPGPIKGGMGPLPTAPPLRTVPRDGHAGFAAGRAPAAPPGWAEPDRGTKPRHAVQWRRLCVPCSCPSDATQRDARPAAAEPSQRHNPVPVLLPPVPAQPSAPIPVGMPPPPSSGCHGYGHASLGEMHLRCSAGGGGEDPAAPGTAAAPTRHPTPARGRRPHPDVFVRSRGGGRGARGAQAD